MSRSRHSFFKLDTRGACLNELCNFDVVVFAECFERSKVKPVYFLTAYCFLLVGLLMVVDVKLATMFGALGVVGAAYIAFSNKKQ